MDYPISKAPLTIMLTIMLAMEVASTPMVPKHIYDGTDYRANPANNTPIGTGPFSARSSS